MGAIRARIISGLLAIVLGALTAWLGTSVTADLTGPLEVMIGALFDGSLILYYAVIHPYLQKKWNPTGAYSKKAARSMENITHTTGLATDSYAPPPPFHSDVEDH